MNPPCLRGLASFAPGIGFGYATAEDEQLPLHPAEQRATAGMLPQRRRDFAIGRLAAHRALAQLGADDGPILMNGRRPLFPPGLTGSLSHSAGVAVAIVAPVARARSLGIDLELQPLPARAVRLVLGPEELRCVDEGSCSHSDVFSAKEAAFKAFDPILDGGLRTLRQIVVEPAEAGIEARLRSWPAPRALVSVCHLPGGVLAWTALEGARVSGWKY